MGFFCIILLMMFRVKGAILIGILVISGLSWIRGTSITAFPYTPEGDASFEYFKTFVSIPSIKHTLFAFDFDLLRRDVWIALFTFLYVDILDTTGTMFSMAKFGGFMDRKGDFEGSYMAFIMDALSICIGACLGSSPNVFKKLTSRLPLLSLVLASQRVEGPG